MTAKNDAHLHVYFTSNSSNAEPTMTHLIENSTRTVKYLPALLDNFEQFKGAHSNSDISGKAFTSLWTWRCFVLQDALLRDPVEPI